MQAFKLFYLGQMFWFSFYKRITISFWVFGPLPLTEPVELGLKQNQLGWVQANGWKLRSSLLRPSTLRW